MSKLLIFVTVFISAFSDVVLYSSHRCPYCKKVDSYLKSVDKSVTTKYVDNNSDVKAELKAVGGRTQVPCLVIDAYPLYGSDEIIQWMKTHPDRLQDGS